MMWEWTFSYSVANVLTLGITTVLFILPSSHSNKRSALMQSCPDVYHFELMLAHCSLAHTSFTHPLTPGLQKNDNNKARVREKTASVRFSQMKGAVFFFTSTTPKAFYLLSSLTNPLFIMWQILNSPRKAENMHRTCFIWVHWFFVENVWRYP